MTMKRAPLYLALILTPFVVRVTAAADPETHPPYMRAGTTPEKRLFEESIRSTKQSIANDTLDVFYRDAEEFYRQRRYAEALEQLDQIYSIDPEFRDVAALRTKIRNVQTQRADEGKGTTIRELMKKGNHAIKRGQNAEAIHAWEEALALNPEYAPAKTKIQEVKSALANKQFEAGYINYRHGDLEDALDCWSNAIALDPSYKRRGLLLLMAKVEHRLKQERVTKLAAQAYEQYLQKDMVASLASYEEVLKSEPRHDEARRMSSKIKIQLGQSVFQAGQEKMAKKAYSEATEDFKASIRYGWEVQKSEQAIKDAEAAIARSKIVVVAKPKPSPPKPETPKVDEGPKVPETASDPEAAMAHYRAGLTAIRSKDYHLACTELTSAARMDPNNDRIYMGQQRACAQWAEIQSGGSR